ncbi:MAG TPA: TldD/PmbA family protein [Candidatus Bathyarchaeia archaeon]|nr:TldD/PmbA family protein [Candidatus Bathyarchaeia archaeon]
MSSNIEDLMDKAIKHAISTGARFAEVKGEDTKTLTIGAINREIRTVSQVSNVGVGVRTFFKKSSGFSFSNVLDEKNIFRAVETAMKIARASTKKTLVDFKPAPVKTILEKKTTSVDKHPKEVSLEDKKDLCLRENSTAIEVSKNISNVNGTFGEYYGTIYYASSEGTKTSYEPLLTGLRVVCVAKRGATIVDAQDGHGGSIGLSTFEEEAHTPESMAKNAANWALEKLKAKPAPAGKFEALIDPRLAGVLAHESFGHLSEGDFVVIGGSPLSGKIGKELGTEDVTIIDEGMPEKGGYALPFDDEGVPCNRVEILKKGVLRHYLQSRVTATALKEEPTGNARSQDYSFEPIVRMRNTYFDRGDRKFEEALKELNQGIYAIDTSGGQVEDTGTFLFKAVRGYWVEKGELKYPLRDVALTGNILELLKKIDTICDDLRIDATPFGGCGKINQRAYVGTGGPHIKIKDVLFGGAA